MSESPNTSGLPQEAMSHLVGKTYVSQGLQNLASVNSNIAELITKRKLPAKSWTDQQIELFLNQLSMMDSNNFSGNAGVGERHETVMTTISNKNWNFGGIWFVLKSIRIDSHFYNNDLN